jgi:hypothetical protein
MTGPQFVGRPDGSPVPVAPTFDPAGPLGVGEYLDRDLKAYARMRDLQDLADQAAAAPLNDVLRDLRTVLTERRLTGADSQRLHVLLSQLYHAHPALDGPQLDQLRSEVNTAWELSRSGAFLRET